MWQPTQFAFLRSAPGQQMVVMVNSAAAPAPDASEIQLRLPVRSGKLVDWLNEGDVFRIDNFQAQIDSSMQLGEDPRDLAVE